MIFPLVAWSFQKQIVTPYAHSAPLSLSSVKLLSGGRTNEPIEFRVDADGTYSNPFDSSDVRLDCKLTFPSGKSLEIPGFLYQGYKRKSDGKAESVERVGDPEWRLRVCPTEVGEYKLRVSFKDKSGSKTLDTTFQAVQGSAPGFVRLSPKDRRYFAFDNGSSYYPIGSNVCWAGANGTYDYDKWLGAFGKQKANFARLWLSPDYVTFAMERTGSAAEGKGMGQFDLANLWKLDYVFGLAEKNGIYLQLCLESYNILREKDAYPYWDKTPHNSDNGGPLRIWTDYWSKPEMLKLYEDRLRYLVARYGANSHLLAWEFWNEVDLTGDYSPTTVRDWHQLMSKSLKKLDVYDHMMTTSLSDSMGDRTIDLVEELDFIQTHHYGSADPGAQVALQQSRKAGWGKAHFFGEVGADASGPRAEDDPEGLQIHDPIWMSFATGASGSAMPWWWDSLTEPKNLYRLFGAAADFAQGIDWAAEEFRQADATLASVDAKPKPRFKDIVFDRGPVSWNKGPGMQPQVVTVADGRYEGDYPAGILHGLTNHPELHNPVAFKLNLARSSALEVEVDEVSGYGGAGLTIKVDGRQVASKEFPSPASNSEHKVLKIGTKYSVTIPKGRHTVTVENRGTDWLTLSYRFKGVVSTYKPPVQAWAITGNNIAIAWLRVEGRNWRNIAVKKRVIAPSPPVVFGLQGIASGDWKVQIWDTWQGKVLSTQTIHVKNDGKIRVLVPSIAKDVALRLDRQGVNNSQ